MGPGDVVAPAEEGAKAAHGAGAVEARGSLTSSERLVRAARLGGAEAYRRVFSGGRRRRLPLLDVRWVESAAGHPRLGLVVPKFQSTAVARNRLRRQLRELWRRRIVQGLPSVDVVVRARREAYGASFEDLARDLSAWADRLRGTG